MEGQAQAYLSHQDCIELTHDLTGVEELGIFKNGVSPGHGITRPKATLQEIEEEIWELLFLQGRGKTAWSACPTVGWPFSLFPSTLRDTPPPPHAPEDSGTTPGQNG